MVRCGVVDDIAMWYWSREKVDALDITNENGYF
jgi:hypothetical protein